MSTNPVSGFGSTSKVTEQAGNAHEAPNAFLIMLYMYLRDINNQADATDGGFNELQLLMSQFSNQNAVVKAKEEALKSLIDEQAGSSDASSAYKIQAAMSDLQAAQSELGLIRNKMNQVFKGKVEPAQQMTQQDIIMFGGLLKLLLLTQRTR